MGGRLFNRRPLVPLPEISRKYFHVENELVRIVNTLLGGVGCVSGVSIHDCVINMTTYNLNGVGGGVCLAETLVVCEPVRVSD